MGDEELRREVESLLMQDVTSDGVLERVAEDAAFLVSAAGRRLPAAIGRYRVLALVGEGGMGLVYEAEQDHPRRVVALKVIRAGLPSADLLRRFDRESHALGRLQHPGIARIYEAGTAETELGPQPYLAMEFIRGASILEHAKAQRLNTRQRLEIMAQVCDAVQHAHQRGIVHRDLKPNNILVDETGQPKILDFGVARITDADVETTRQTGLGELVGTLTYMSPEQVLGDPLELDARSDIYSIGVVLYELLAGCLPYKVDRKVYEAARTIREESPAPLGRVSGAYRGDLETIVAKALDKDKARRYESASGLATDIRRFLHNEPILARPPSAGYQLRKFSIRHKGLVGAVIAILVALVVGILVSTREAIRADRAERTAIAARDRAIVAERTATKERDKTVRAVQSANRERQRAEQERNHAVEETQRADTEAATAKAVNDFLQNDLLAEAAAQTQSGPNTKPNPDLRVRTALDRAAARIAGKLNSQPAVEASIRDTIGITYSNLGLLPQAQSQLERALELRRLTLGAEHKDTLHTIRELGDLYIREGKYASAEPLLIKLVETLRHLRGDGHPDTLGAVSELALLASASRGDHAHAEALLAKVLEVQRHVIGESHPDTLAVMNNLAVQYTDEGKYAQAEELYKETVRIKRRVLGEEHPQTLLSMNSLGVTYRKQGKYAEAEPLLTAALEARRRVEGDQHNDTLASMNSLALLYEAEGKYAQAEPLLKRTIETRGRVLGEDNPDTLASMNNLADLYLHVGRRTEAELLFHELLERRRRVLGAEHPNTAKVLTSLGELKLEQRECADAERFFREALSVREKKTPDAWERFYVQSLLGAALAGQTKYADAEPLLIAGYQGLIERRTTIPFENRSALDQIPHWIVQLYESWAKPDKALAWRDPVAKR
jgi:tetratricopeptide (TPR) repeat protein